MLAPALGHLGVALPAAEQQSIRAVTYQVAAVALLGTCLGPMGAVLLPLIGGRLEVMGRLAGGPPQDPTVWPGLDLRDHAPHKQDDLAGAAPGSWGWGWRGHIEKLSLGETNVSQGRDPQGQRGGVWEGEKPLMSGQEGR